MSGGGANNCPTQFVYIMLVSQFILSKQNQIVNLTHLFCLDIVVELEQDVKDLIRKLIPNSIM
ncbi:hypothetical protein TSUD_206860 [Trifolium subterraneum]|uniref:Uncharacterized protein n=1 Tax=Trifolium subterraneum TaxID=3900 RepID=A0A2Z6NLQ1_TRISU|nr:hypothetical protein TSUD_206860 [Trifolium subterraneum]